jgi:hypothetical protein
MGSWMPWPRPGDKWHLDEVFIKIAGQTNYLWRAVDQQGTVLDILITSRRDAKAATRFFRKLLKGLEYVPRVLVTDKLASYGVARRRLMRGTRVDFVGLGGHGGHRTRPKIASATAIMSVLLSLTPATPRPWIDQVPFSSWMITSVAVLPSSLHWPCTTI